MPAVKEKQKITPWRIAAGIVAIAFITYMWARKDLVTLYSTMPGEQLAPLLITTLAVTLLKVGALSGTVLLIRRITGKLRQK